MEFRVAPFLLLLCVFRLSWTLDSKWNLHWKGCFLPRKGLPVPRTSRTNVTKTVSACASTCKKRDSPYIGSRNLPNRHMCFCISEKNYGSMKGKISDENCQKNGWRPVYIYGVEAMVVNGNSKQKGTLTTKTPFIKRTKQQSSRSAVRPTKGSTSRQKTSSKVTITPKNRQTKLKSSQPIIGSTNGSINRRTTSSKILMHKATLSSIVSTRNLNTITQVPITATLVNSTTFGEKASDNTEANDNILTALDNRNAAETLKGDKRTGGIAGGVSAAVSVVIAIVVGVTIGLWKRRKQADSMAGSKSQKYSNPSYEQTEGASDGDIIKTGHGNYYSDPTADGAGDETYYSQITPELREGIPADRGVSAALYEAPDVKELYQNTNEGSIESTNGSDGVVNVPQSDEIYCIAEAYIDDLVVAENDLYGT